MNNLLGLVPSILMMASPILICALGGMVSERAGVVNIGLEGLMGFGAFAAATVNVLIEAVMPGAAIWVSLLAATVIGALVSLIHAFACISLNADQTVSGTGINLLANGLTVFFCQIIFHHERTNSFRQGMQPGLGGIYPTAYIAVTLLAIVWYILYRRPTGLRLRACGENPQAAASAGIDVKRLRYWAVFSSGGFGGLAGGCLVLTQTIEYKENMINGAGFIALAAVSFGRWKPKGVTGAACLFGAAVALAIYVVNIPALKALPAEFFNVLPYVITLITLVLFSGKDYAPSAAGQPYEKGSS
jgi:simple sugar transport system permease protein